MRDGMTHPETLLPWLRTTLSWVSTGLAFLDGAGNCIFINPHAEMLLDGHLGLRIAHGRLRAHKSDSEKLERMIEAAIASEGTPHALITVHDLAGKPSLVLALRALEAPVSQSTAQQARAVAIMRAVAPQIVDAEERLAVLFSLSLAEASLAWALFETGDLAEACQRLDKSLSTGRSQLRAILAKTHCRRQGELFRVIAAATSIIGYPKTL